ncbi:creatininase family protein [Polaribacter atrinae]|uniref:creatininase family protein n=1 Tax=Polaribacter atrinae TaxID=1333662 RepID=UPI0030F68F89
MENSIRPYVLADINWKTVKETDYKVAILPWGATEAHNYHLPYATDNFQAEFVAIEAAKKAWEKKAKVIVLPTIPFGVNTGQMDVKLCMNMSPSTQYAVLKDVVQVLNAHDIQKLVIVNSHGGNNFKQMIRELSLAFPKNFVCAINWWQVANANDYFNEPGDHAGELETSAIMHIKPHLVLPLEEAGNGTEKKFKIKGLKEGWVSTQRQWTEVTKDTGVGNPKFATAEKGKIFLEVVVDKVAEFFGELYHADAKNMYE